MSNPAVPTAPSQPLGSVLVTGGCGFLGSHIVSLLLNRYTPPTTRISVLDLRLSADTHAGVQYHTADLTDPSSVRPVLDKVKPDVVIHTASPAFVGTYSQKKIHELFYRVNVDGTRVLLEECKKVGVKAFVYTSSSGVISDARKDMINADERYPVIRGKLQKEYYAGTKAEAEELVLAANARTTPFLTCALRPSAIFGERDMQTIPGFLWVAQTGRTRWQIGDNDNLFDWTYVGNVAHAHALAASKLLQLASDLSGKDGEKSADLAGDESPDGEAFQITNDSPTYFWDFPRAIWQSYYDNFRLIKDKNPSSAASCPPTNTARTRLPRFLAMFFAVLALTFAKILRAGDPSLTPYKVKFSCMTRYFRPAKATVLLGYRPVWSFGEGVERTGRWFAERDVKAGLKKDD